MLILMLAAVLAGGLAAPAPIDLELNRLTGPIRLDGALDESAWGRIAPLPVTMHLPTFEGRMTERTEIRVAYDDGYIYVAARLHDASPDGIRANSLYRDATNGDDRVGIFLDTYDDNRNGLHFWVNPRGIRSDAAVSDDGNSFNYNWNTFWDASARIDEEGWSAEIRIPFSSLGFAADGSAVRMGLVVYRDIARRNERHVYPSLSPERHIWTPSRASDVLLRDVESSEPVYVTPYLLGGAGQTAGLNTAATAWDVDRTTTGDLGLDVKYNLTTRLTLDATVNTDFAQAEADDQQVNLTRFSLFFPEKRRFFQERSGLFQFRTANERLFHSRRIGLNQGSVIPILGGARLAGRAGDWDVGILNIQTAASGTISTENFGVARFQRRVINENSAAGAMVTSRTGADGSWNLAYGLDGTFRLAGSDYLLMNWAQTADDAVLDAHGFRFIESSLAQIRLERRRSTGWSYNATLTRMGKDFSPDLGFITRRDYTELSWLVHYNTFPGEDSRFNRTMPVHVNGALDFRNEDGSLESGYASILYFLWPKSGSQIGLSASLNHEDLRIPLALPGQSEVGAGSYLFPEASASYRMSSGRELRTSLNAGGGAFYDGWRTVLGISPAWNLSRHLELGASWSLNRVRFPDREEARNDDANRLSGDGFDAHILQLRMRTALDAQLSLNSFVQYNSAANVVTINARLRYNFREGNDLWIVYNEGLNTDRARFDPVLPATGDRTILVKYTHTFAL